MVVGWEFGDGIFERIETFTLLAAGFFLCHRKLQKHRYTLEEHAMKAAFYIFAASFLISTVFVAPFIKDKKSINDISDLAKKNGNLQLQLDDKSSKLHGFINRTFITDEAGSTNSLVFLEVVIDNSGASPSSADQFELKVLTKNSTNYAEEIYFTNEYTLNFLENGKPYLLDLKRSELISEKAHMAIQRGDSPRGWVAFRLNGIPEGKQRHIQFSQSL
jgi:hypothetical protein